MFRVIIEVRKYYIVDIEAPTKKEAVRIGNTMQTTAIYEKGELLDVETAVLGVETE